MTIDFSKEARRHFDPVAQQFGLVCAVSTKWELRYENDLVSLNINFDSGRSYELGVEVGRPGDRFLGHPFSLAEILRLRDIQDVAFVSGLMIDDEIKLPNALAQLAELTVRHASDFLKGEDPSFAQIEKFRNKECAEFEIASQLRHARSIVDVAWAAKDYGVIVKVFEPLEAHLSSAEKKCLAYARKQLLKALGSNS